jgi:membrane protein implicated in regulation of membrane protease activity
MSLNHSMTWADFYLICFAVGFCFSFFSFIFGGARTGRLHLPHFHGHVSGAHISSAGGIPAAHGTPGYGTPGNWPATAGHAAAAGDAHTDQGGGVSPFNFVTLTAFLAWFGGTGFLLTRYSGLWVGFGLLAAVAGGLVGGGIVFVFLSRVLISSEENMDSADYEMVGVLGRVCSFIREHGTGEIIYTQMGTRRVCGARSDDGSPIAKGTEVVVTRYDKGIAYVRRWSEMSGEDQTDEDQSDDDRPSDTK